MRIGVYSDVHANYLALKTVLKAFDEMKDLEFFACLGDLVGYGPLPDQCCDEVKKHARYTMLGNHDAAVCGRMDYTYYYPAAREALDHHASLLKPENMEFLKSLPYTYLCENVCFSHGSPVNAESFDYVFTPEHAESLLEHWDELAEITVIGHSHLRKSYRLHPPGSDPKVEEIEGEVLQLQGPAKYVITVGSVGQPRDNDARACFTVLDTDERTLAYHRVDYDIFETSSGIWESEHLAPDFGKRLFLGV
jgi:predicted phosphodiesterase